MEAWARVGDKTVSTSPLSVFQSPGPDYSEQINRSIRKHPGRETCMREKMINYEYTCNPRTEKCLSDLEINKLAIDP